MDSDWQEVYQIQLPSPNVAQYGPIPNIGTIAFDTQQELLWVGDNFGRILSYWFNGQRLERYTALKAHPESEGPVHQILFNERGVISLAARSVHLMTRRALTQWHIEEEDMTELSCMTFLRKDCSQILVAGCQQSMYKIDAEKGLVMKRLGTNSHYTMMKYNRYICAATSTGAVDFLDPLTLHVMKSWQAHTAKINSMDAKNDFLITCGWSTRPYGHSPSLDTLAKVFDLKRLEQLAPISFHAGAAFVQIHPKTSTTSVISSQNGQIHVTDIMDAENVKMLHVTLASSLVGLVMSPSGNVWAIADQDNVVSIWGSLNNLQFCETSNPIEFADEVAPVPYMAVDSDLPFSTIGMPYYRERLLSAWGNDRVFEVGQPPTTAIDVPHGSRRGPGNIGHIAPNPRKSFRNQVSREVSTSSNGDAGMAPKYLSDKTRILGNGEGNAEDTEDILEAFTRFALSSNTGDVPPGYEELKIKYGGPRGVQDFDFGYYNRTCFSGLENDIANSYMNPLLQIFKFTPLIRNLALHHVAGSCIQEGCLLCETGFLFDMLEKAGGDGGKVCRATNFLKTYSTLPSAIKMNTVEENAPQNPLDMRLLAANRFLLQQLCDDYKRDYASGRTSHYDPILDQTLETTGIQALRCLNCHNETFRHEPSHTITLIYPDQSTAGRHRPHVPRFSEVLDRGFQGEAQARGWCQRCNRYTPMASRRTITGTANVLIINPGLDKSPKSRSAWAAPSWLPREIGVTVEGGNLICSEGDQLRPFRSYRGTAIYELVGLVVDVKNAEPQKHHLVSFIDVAISQREAQYESQWHLFNDFMVGPVSQQEALSFVSPWKTPVLLAYQRQEARHNIDDTWKKSLDINCLYYNGSMNLTHHPTGVPLKPTIETPLSGTHVAIDAEFVVLQRESFDINADGERKTTRPVRQGLGRVSCLRGDSTSPDEGIAFIDDYVTIHEPIVDYVTQFSGIEPGDLDPARSNKAPISLKMAYKKLWLLLNLGCVFVGHGLTSDFRHANMFVPENQSIDTSLLFKKGERTLKLSLLADFFLKEDIQTGNHDSIEDARTALRLWRKYQDFEAKGVVEQKIDEVYRYGRKHQYQPAREFEAGLGVRGHGHGSRSTHGGGSSAELNLLGLGLGGRMTPEVGGGSSVGGSGPVTPQGRGKGGGREVEGMGMGYFESPLR